MEAFAPPVFAQPCRAIQFTVEPQSDIRIKPGVGPAVYQALNCLCTRLVPAETDVLSVVSLQSSSDSIAACRYNFPDLPKHTVAVDCSESRIGPGKPSVPVV